MAATFRHIVFAAATVLGCLMAPAASAWADVLVVQGSTTFHANVMVPYRADIEAVSGHQLRVVPTKSNRGLLALLSGETDLAMISSPLDSEIALLKPSRPELPWRELHAFLISHTRVAFAVHPGNPVRAARWSTLRRILGGDITNWKQVGGRDLPINVVAVRSGGGVLLSVEKHIMRGEPIAAPSMVTVETGPEVPLAVANDPGALGLAQLAEVRRHKLPEIVVPTMVEQPLSLVTRGEPTPAMYAVIDAARRVVQGQLD